MTGLSEKCFHCLMTSSDVQSRLEPVAKWMNDERLMLGFLGGSRQVVL